MDSKSFLIANKTALCPICKRPVLLTSSLLKELDLILHKDNEHELVRLTIFCCPCCGKEYPVIIDDEETLQISKEVQRLFTQQLRYSEKQKKIPQKLEKKYQAFNRKLDFKRHMLAKKFNGAFYQIEGNTVQLDYCYHAQ